MFYAICDGVPGSDGPPFLFYKFKTLKAVKTCKAVNEHSYVFDGKETVDRLNHLFTKEEITSVCEPFGKPSSAENFWVLTASKAKYWKPEEETKMNRFVKGDTSSVEVVTEQPDVDPHTRITLELDEMEKEGGSFDAIKKTPDVKKGWSNECQIIKLMDEPPIKQGTNRYRNMQVVLASQTVGEAISALRKLDPSPGGRMDLRIAVKAGAIKIDNPHFQPLGEK
tara:strand:- start:12088 stop:12759 length:672 start_codon:yes stop_codon:yes gene_type:complete